VTIVQYIIRDEKTGCHYTGGYQTLVTARRGARKLVSKYGGAVYICGTDGRDEQILERCDAGAWR
jgi:hypothetical protein